MAELTKVPFASQIELLRAHAQACPGGVAMRQKRLGIWHEFCWAELRTRVQALAAGLLEFGVPPGAHVGILSENRGEWVQAQFAIMAAGGVTVGMYPTSPAREIAHLVTASDTEVLFIEDQEQYDKLRALDGQLPRLRKLVVFDPRGLHDSGDAALMSFDDLLAQGHVALPRHNETLAARAAALAPADTAMMVFTSGSTGLPKAAEISHGNLWAAHGIAQRLFDGFAPGTNILSYLPLCHIAEQNITVVGALAGRRVMNFGESLRTVTRDLRDVAPEIFFGVPRIWEKMQAAITVQAATTGALRRRLTRAALASATRRGARPRAQWSRRDRLQHAAWDLVVYRHLRAWLGLSRCRMAISAAAPITRDQLAFFRGLGLDLREAWGMSETTGAATIQPPRGACEGRVGPPLDGVQLRLAEDGELLVRGPIVFKGYYRNPVATAEALRDGWLHTGDMAAMHSDGSITITDRKKDIMINAAGKNLSPALIEGALKASPHIKECVAIADARPYVSALIQIDPETVQLWAEAQGIGYTTFRSLAENPAVRDLIADEVARANRDLARVAQVRRFHLLTRELDHDDGEVTATMKLRRATVQKTYAREIEGLYE